jgi:hypothetical protein
MRKKYMGDSFDIVKRFWAQWLRAIAPLLAHPRFVPVDIKPQFENMVGIRVLGSKETPVDPFGLFFDPNTGVPLPSAVRQTPTASHAPLAFIESECSRLKPTYAICFDQSHDRAPGMSRADQRAKKRADLRSRNLASFYYVSHAPFLFAASDKVVLEALYRRLIESGIPEWRFESEDLPQKAG